MARIRNTNFEGVVVVSFSKHIFFSTANIASRFPLNFSFKVSSSPSCCVQGGPSGEAGVACWLHHFIYVYTYIRVLLTIWTSVHPDFWLLDFGLLVFGFLAFGLLAISSLDLGLLAFGLLAFRLLAIRISDHSDFCQLV